jgi:hypothetical protein
MINDLRVECEVLRARLGLNKKGSCRDLAKSIGVNSNSLNMALSGFRTGPGSEQLLAKLRDHLIQLRDKDGGLPMAANG